MDVYLPQTLAEALEVKAAHPDALPIAGGTDVMVEINFDRRRPASILDLTRAAELQTWRHDDGTITLGAGVSYTRIVRELSVYRPLVEASRTVGSPQIRSRGTVGGNLGTASPAGDALPVLAAYDADVILAKAGGVVRSLPWHRFHVGPKKTALAPEAEQFATRAWREAGVWADPRAPVADGVIDEFGERVAAAARPIDDVRGTAAYRRHACAVLARRALRWAMDDRRLPGPGTPRGAGVR